jgi:hypothetical protein
MNNTYLVTRSTTGRWAHITWSADTPPTDEHDWTFRQAARVAGVRYAPERQQLSIPHTAYMLPQIAAVAKVVGARLVTEPLAFDIDRPLDNPPCRSPYTHQLVAASRAVGVGALLLADDMGLGKTTTALVAAKNAAPDAPKLILAPKFVRAVWRNELLVLGYLDDGPQGRRPGKYHGWCALEGRTMSDAIWRPDAEWYFVHYEIVSAWWSKLANLNPPAVILDEVHRVKNGRTKVGAGVKMALGPAPFRILLTGTPMENRVSELWHLLSLTTGIGTWGSPLDFRKRYCGAFHNGYGYEDSGPRFLEELHQRMAPWYMRRTIDDIGLELPDLSRQVIECELSKGHMSMHDKMFEGVEPDALLRALTGGQAGERALEIVARLRSITSTAKLQSTVEYIDNQRQQGISVVCFTWQRSTARSLAACFEKRDTIYIVDGKVPSGARDTAIDCFQRTGGIFFATIDAMREGVTLTKARCVVIHDLHWTPTAILQAERRIHRIGQREGCVSAWMVARDTIDELLAKTLRYKIQCIEETLGDTFGRAAYDLEDFAYDDSIETQLRSAIQEWRTW